MADRHVGVAQPFATVQLALGFAGNGDVIHIHATAGAPTNFDEANVNVTQDDLTIQPAAGDDGLITIRPAINFQDEIWECQGDRPIIQRLLFAHNSKNVGVGMIRTTGSANGIIRDCSFDVLVANYGLSASGGSTGWGILECDFTGQGSGINATGLTGLVQDCTFDIRQKGIDGAVLSGLFVDRCEFQGGGGGVSYGIDDLRDGVVVTNSIFFELWKGIESDVACVTGGVYNCTFEDCVDGIFFGGGDKLDAIDNCAFVNCGDGISGGGAGANAPDSCLFFNNTRDVWNYTAAVNSQTTDPQFTDEAGHDYTFGTGSPLKDNGTALPGIVDFDYVGTARPRGSGWDIGAYEPLISPFVASCPDRHTAVLTFDDPMADPADNLDSFSVVVDSIETDVSVTWAILSDSQIIVTLHLETGMSPGGTYAISIDGVLDALGAPVIWGAPVPVVVPADDVLERAEWNHGLLRVITRACAQNIQEVLGRLATISREDYVEGSEHLLVESTIGWPDRGAFFVDGRRFRYRGVGDSGCKLMHVKADFPEMTAISRRSLVILDHTAVPEDDFELLWPVGSF